MHEFFDADICDTGDTQFITDERTEAINSGVGGNSYFCAISLGLNGSNLQNRELRLRTCISYILSTV